MPDNIKFKPTDSSNTKDGMKMEAKYTELVNKAHQAYENAYAPYSNYKVGAAVLWYTGVITSGTNVENASYGLTVCAERNAITTGIGIGERKITAIAIAVGTENMPAPCGACRQVIREFASDCTILLSSGQREIKKTSLKKLFPDSFGPEFLNKIKKQAKNANKEGGNFGYKRKTFRFCSGGRKA